MAVDRERLEELRIDRGEEAAPSRRPWVWGLLVAFLVGAGALGLWAARPAAPEVRVAVAEEVEGRSRAAVLNASGYVTARRQATVSSKVTGKVLEVMVEEGMEVEEGELLARLDAATPAAALALDQALVAAARSALAETRVRIEEARLDLERAESLMAGGVTSQAELDRARAAFDALEARLAAQREELAVARRQVALSRQAVEDTEIRAPFAGVVVSKNAQPGEMISPVSAGGGFTRTGICTIVDMDSLEIEVDVNEAYLNRVEAGQPVEAVLDAYPEWTIPGHVITVVPTADRQKATVKVRIAFDERDERVLPDMGVKVTFVAPEPISGAPPLRVPRSAVVGEGETDVVWVVHDGEVERRAVGVGASDGDQVEIAAGLRPGERVVLSPPGELADGDRVKVVEEGAQ